MSWPERKLVTEPGRNAVVNIHTAPEWVRLEQIGLGYPRREGLLRTSIYWALKDVSFMIRRGETVGIIGRNGAGKTSLLRLLAGIISPDRGRCWYQEGVRTAMLSLQAGFINTLTGRQNAVISGMTLGLSKKKIEAFMPQVVEFAELDDFIDQPVAAYSAGMKARLGFAVAMHVDPDILLIDEVISVGDEDFRKKSARVIEERVSANETTVLVTHNAQLARSLCSRLIWIDRGVVRMDGGTEEVLGAYLG